MGNFHIGDRVSREGHVVCGRCRNCLAGRRHLCAYTNHASIIDGIRLSKAACFRYPNGDMDDLESKLKEAVPARHRMIVTDGVFSMDGYFAKLDRICDPADEYDALVMVDDSRAVGFIGEHGRGTPKLCGV